MAKQKIVVKVTMNCPKKRSKALKIVVSLFGVESVSFVGSDKDRIEVTGEEMNSIDLTKLLREGVGFTELVSVGPVEEKAKETKPTIVPWQMNPYGYYFNGYGMSHYY